MQRDHQSALFEIIKRKINGESSLGDAVGEVLSLSNDAVYRRYRGETQLTIYELEKLSKHYSISLDSLFETDDHKVIFEFQPTTHIDFNMDSYLEKIAFGFESIRKQKSPELMMAINNTHFLQLLNFPHLTRFKLFFWGKTYLRVPELNNERFAHKKMTENQDRVGRQILRNYTSIPSKELLDPEFMLGFTREIHYYFNARQFEDPMYAVHLLNHLIEFVEHIKHQCEEGKKFVYKTAPPANGNELEVYLNDTINGATVTYYRTEEREGINMAHNLMNTMNTFDKEYVQDARDVLQRQFENSSLISTHNPKERNQFFFKLIDHIEKVKRQIQQEIDERS
ncbi:MAG: hypothetical protein AB8B56_12145 [Crocinitomicaceae bacterium]